MTFNDALPVVLKFEGGYVNDPKDPGGATNKGVTQATYNLYRKMWQLSPQHVRYITDAEVAKIYESYWRQSKSNTISLGHPLSALVHFDFSINAGFTQAAKTLQRTLGLELVDGIIGNGTLSALNKVDDLEFATKYLYSRIEFYNKLVEKKPDLSKFLKGWLWRINRLRNIINDWSDRSKQTDAAASIT